MNEYVFTMYLGKEILLTTHINLENNEFIIEDKENSYEINFNNINLVFKRKTDESIFTLEIYKGEKKSKLELLKENIEVDIPLEFADYIHKEDGFDLIYKLESQDLPIKMNLKIVQ